MDMKIKPGSSEGFITHEEFRFDGKSQCKSNRLLLSPRHRQSSCMKFYLHRCSVGDDFIPSNHCRLKSFKNSILAVLFPIMAGRPGARINPLEILELVDIGECLQSRIELPELFNRHIAGINAPDHRAEGMGLVILKVSQKN